jgi:hypothetical protein
MYNFVLYLQEDILLHKSTSGHLYYTIYNLSDLIARRSHGIFQNVVLVMCLNDIFLGLKFPTCAHDGFGFWCFNHRCMGHGFRFLLPLFSTTPPVSKFS